MKDVPDQNEGLSVKNLSVGFHTRGGFRPIVENVSFDIRPGERVGVVGESGSGKSVTMMAAMGLLPESASVTADHILVNGNNMLGASDADLNEIRGNVLSMVFQNPMTTLNPSLQIGTQVSESVEVHDRTLSRSDLEALAVRMLETVGVPNPPARAKQYPHEFSGGMRQRGVIAMALAGEPALVIADEPTTALDVTVQSQIVALMQDLSTRLSTGSVIITHDLGLIAELADRVMVMYAGRIVEKTSVFDLFARPGHPYTQALLKSRPALTGSREKLHAIPGLPPRSADDVKGCPFHPRCHIAKGRDTCANDVPVLREIAPGIEAACHFHEEVAGYVGENAKIAAERDAANPKPTETVLELENLTKHYGAVKALNGVSLSLKRGETLGLVGESGCGKSTLARLTMGLVAPTSGKVEVKGREISALSGRDLRLARRDIQMVFQDPTSSLDRRMVIETIIAEPMVIAGYEKTRIEKRITELMAAVSLPEHYRTRRPAELSGGQRQRVGIARALALDPDVIILDEPTSALDVSVQAQIINLLDDLRNADAAGYIFIAHDLGVVRHVSDRVAVMYLGRIVEIADRDALFDNPVHPYTRALLSSVPASSPEQRDREKFVVSGSPPDPINIPTGCGFRNRCPIATDLCAKLVPELDDVETGNHRVACHRKDEKEAIFSIPAS